MTQEERDVIEAAKTYARSYALDPDDDPEKWLRRVTADLEALRERIALLPAD